jgi:2-keto-4-pentenoate hydratase/2-oxohepta-3-ene-1,7-dioic acid hydratase in catechol pathway
MRFITYSLQSDDDGPHFGMLLGDRVINVAAAAKSLGLADVHDDMIGLIRQGEGALKTAQTIAAKLDGDREKGFALTDVRLFAPIVRPERNVMCVGLNYADHVAESKSVVADADVPKFPVFFTKPPSCVIGPDAEIPWHGHVSTAIDWEVELAVIIGREGRNIAVADALKHVFGYTVANDVTARDLQQRHGQWFKGKGLDGFCPLGPVVVTGDEVGDPQALDVALRVNGTEKQRSNTRYQIFPVARLIAELSAGMTLIPGDILLTGTPSGVGIGRTPPEFLKPGDIVEAEVQGIGILRNTVGG